MIFFGAFAILLLLTSIEGQGEHQDPIRIRSQVISAQTAGTCPTDLVNNVTDELRQSISNILTGTHYSCGGTSGWSRVGYLDMTDPSQSCPSEFQPYNYNEIRTCGRFYDGDFGSCLSTFYNSSSLPYSKVCGRIEGYQFGATSAFTGPLADIASAYVDGVSLTHGYGDNRTHIWTFATSLSEVDSTNNRPRFCPCMTTEASQPPPFVGNDYFCESGSHDIWPVNVLSFQYRFYPNDPLWDGRHCTLTCCQKEYFTQTLLTPTTDDIELRICSNGPPNLRDVLIYHVELYVQ